MRRSLLACLIVTAACTARDTRSTPTPGEGAAPVETTGVVTQTAATPSATATATASAAASAPVAAAPVPAAIAARRAPGSPAIVRGLYVNRFAAQGTKKLNHLLAIADSTEINAFVVDMKDEFGLNYRSANPDFARNEGTSTKVANVRALLDSLRAHDVLAIARIVVFKDSVTARVNPEWTIRRTDGTIWRDHKGLAWVNPYHRSLWDYNIGVAEELVRLGFDEVQFDYIRFPEPYKSLPQQVFPGSDGHAKPDAIADFLKVAKTRLNAMGVRSTADIFGLVTTVNGPLEVAQHWERLSPVTDVLLPMVYPSHYPRGAFGIDRPNADPYKVIFTAIKRARERDEKLGIRTPEHVRPWLQAFTLGQPRYGAEQIDAQKRAVYDAGYDGWVLWHPGSQYDVFVPALEKETVTRRKAPATASR